MLLNGREECSCPKKKCVRHGDCKACAEHHRERGQEPYCIRKKEKAR